MKSSNLRSWLALAALASISAIAACGGAGTNIRPVETPAASGAASTGPSPTPVATATPIASAATPSAAPTPRATPDTIALKAYFLLFVSSDDSPAALVPVNRDLPRTAGVARAAMELLLDGPTDDERAHDLRLGTIGTRIPEGTRLLDIEIEGRTATVDLSREFASGEIDGDERESWAYRLAQVTYTLTQFPTVESVRFKVDGKPAAAIEGHEGTAIELATRDAYADQRPGIFVDDPAWGGTVTDPLLVSGMVQTAAEPPQFQAALVDRPTDRILAAQTVRASCPTGCWQPPGGGEFQVRLSIPAGADSNDLSLRVWEVSQVDGSPINVVEYPLR